MELSIATGRNGVPDVHTAGCADVARGLASGTYVNHYLITAGTVEDAARDYWRYLIADEGMSDADAQAATEIAPCAWKT